jgi:hypothetical protein
MMNHYPTSFTSMAATQPLPQPAVANPTSSQLYRAQHNLTLQQRHTETALRTVSKRAAQTEQALQRHVKRLEWMLCAAFAMLCLLMITVGLIWRRLP